MEYHLEYRCKTTKKIAYAKKNLDRSYKVLLPESKDPVRMPRSQLVLNFRFFKDHKKRKGIRVA